MLPVDGGPVLLEDGGPVLLEDGGMLFLEEGGPMRRADLQGTQWDHDDRGVSHEALDSGTGGGSCSIASCKN